MCLDIKIIDISAYISLSCDKYCIIYARCVHHARMIQICNFCTSKKKMLMRVCKFNS